MSSPLFALTWEIWRRGRRSACLALGCVCVCALVNLLTPEGLTGHAIFQALFGLLMVTSFLLLMGIFNYTEFSSSREWNGFPYRLFSLPLRTWQLVTLPMFLGVASVELMFFAWIKLVWTHEKIEMPEWFAVVLGAYMVFYQAALWGLAGFRVVRLLALSLGGVSSILIVCLPLFDKIVPSPWFSEARLIPMMVAATSTAFVAAWIAVARQRSGGGFRQNWLKLLAERISDVMPRRTKGFLSPAAAQFWFEWRRAGWLLPACTAFVLLLIFVPFSLVYQHNAASTVDALVRALAVPVVLAFAIGKAFIKAEFWSMDLALPPFLATRPIATGEIVISKMKVAALSVAITWLLVIAFVAVWLPVWADTTSLKKLIAEFKMFYPNSWLAIVVLYFLGFMVLTWRCLVSGLWVGLSGKRSWYIAAASMQVIIPALLLLTAAICSDAIDRRVRRDPEFLNAASMMVIGWVLAALVIGKLWIAVYSWSKITPRRTGQYLLIWSAATLGFVTLGIISRPWVDMYRVERLYVLGALLLFPFARLGLAPLSLAKNRHG